MVAGLSGVNLSLPNEMYGRKLNKQRSQLVFKGSTIRPFWQPRKDFLDVGGFGHALGNDVTKLADECLPGARSQTCPAADYATGATKEHDVSESGMKKNHA